MRLAGLCLVGAPGGSDCIARSHLPQRRPYSRLVPIFEGENVLLRCRLCSDDGRHDTICISEIDEATRAIDVATKHAVVLLRIGF